MHNMNESTIENINFLKKIAKIILDNISFKRKKYIILKGRDIKQELQNVVDDENVLDTLTSSNYYFINYPTKSPYNGFYDPKNNRLLINLDNIRKNNENILKVLVHELRHIIQYSQYPEFMTGEIKTTKYKKRKIEIDSSFYELLSDNDPTSFNTPKEYATRILENLIKIRDLSDNQIRHYYKKTLDYFYQNNEKIKKEFVEDIVKKIFNDKKYTNTKSFLNAVISYIYGEDFEKNMLTTRQEKRDYNYIFKKALDYYRSSSNRKTLKESTAKTLYHGTLKKNLPSIMKYGVEPNAGDFTRNAYIEYEEAGIELPELVFAADKQGLQKTISAIWGAMENNGIPITKENFFKHAAIVVFREGEDYFEYNPDEFSDNPYPTVEPEDYYREYNWVPDYALTGKKLLRFLRKHDINLEYGFGNLDPESKKSKLIRNIVKKYPEIDKNKLKYMTVDQLKKL